MLEIKIYNTLGAQICPEASVVNAHQDNLQGMVILALARMKMNVFNLARVPMVDVSTQMLGTIVSAIKVSSPVMIAKFALVRSHSATNSSSVNNRATACIVK